MSVTFEHLFLWLCFFVALCLLLIVVLICVEILSDAIPFAFYRRPWDPCGERPSEVNETDLRSIYLTSVRAASCRSARVGHCSDECRYCRAGQGVLKALYSADSHHRVGPVEFDRDSGKVRVYFERIRGPLNGRGWVFHLSRRRSGNWGLDEVEGVWLS